MEVFFKLVDSSMFSLGQILRMPLAGNFLINLSKEGLDYLNSLLMSLESTMVRALTVACTM